MLPKRCFFGKSVDITHICWTEIIQRVFNPNRSLGLAWILSFRRLDFVWLLTKKWARCLPNLGTLLTQHGHGAYPGWAELTTDSCPIRTYCNIRIPAFRLLPMHGKKNIAQEKDLSDILFFGYISLFHHLDDTWRHLAALDADEEDGSLDIGEGSKGRRDLSG